MPGVADRPGGGLAVRPSLSVARRLTARLRRGAACLGLLCVGIAASTAAMAQSSSSACAPTAALDWMNTTNPLAQDVRPHDCEAVLQSPPDFRWPDVISSGGYQVSLTYPDGRVRSLAASQNWLNWDEVLAPGTYWWSVNYSGGTSKARRFIVDGNSLPFLLPSTTTLLGNISAKPHPRSLPDGKTLSAMSLQRASAVNSLFNDVSGHLNQALPSAGGSADDAYTYSKLALSSLMACVYSNMDSYCNDAIRRTTNLSSWDPNGATSYSKSGLDMAARYLTWTVALGYDWLYPRLTASQRGQMLSTLTTRNGVMYNDVIGTRSRVAAYPRDSHANLTLMVVAKIAVLTAGDLPLAATWLRSALPQAMNAINPWGGDEGGFANGATQGNWDVGEMLPVFYGLYYASGLNVVQKPWMRNWSRYFTYFTPPGMAAGTTVFGDGFEMNEFEHQARYGKGYTYFAPTPLGRWHMAQLTAEDPTRIEYLMAPPADFSGPQAFPVGTPNSLFLPSIGQAAMHSDLSNSARTSVYFKSSPPPYGAYNHSHADQNSFVVNAGGQRLAIESGYYDDYKTAHWWNWYHTTKAKNAITYDGGLGQLFYELNDKMGYGKITGFVATPNYDIVSGDATAAYGGALTLAQRSLVYLRPNLILVYDNLASATSRQWEWNIHSLNQMTATSNTTATIQNSGQSLCVTLLAGPAMNFAQTNQFASNPTGNWAAQWHGRFSSTTRLPATEIVTLLNVGCTPIAASATKSAGVWTVTLGDKAVVTIDASGVAVGKQATLTPVPAPAPVPPTSSGSKPFTGTPIAIPATFEAERFDLGGEGLAYHDSTKGNAGGQFRTSENVDIIASCDPAGGGYVVNNITAGEWLAYSIKVPASGYYDIGARLASNYPTGAFHVEIDGINVTGSIGKLNSGGWCNFQWYTKTRVPLTAGAHILKLFADQQYFNLNSLRVTVSP